MTVEDTEPDNETKEEMNQTEEKMRKRIFGSIAESTKKIVTIVVSALSFLITGRFIPPELVVPFVLTVIFVLFGILSYYMWRIISKNNKELYAKYDAQRVKYEKDQKEIRGEFAYLRGKVSNLEYEIQDIVFEIDLTTQRITHANANFKRILGWTIEEVNNFKARYDENWVDWVAHNLIDVVDRKNFREAMAMITYQEPKSFYKCFIKRKNGTAFPSTFKAYFIYEQEQKIVQCFMSDERYIKDMKETILAQNETINNLTKGLIGISQNNEIAKQFVSDLQEEVKRMEQKGLLDNV